MAKLYGASRAFACPEITLCTKLQVPFHSTQYSAWTLARKWPKSEA